MPPLDNFVERGSHLILDLVERRWASKNYVWAAFLVIMLFDWLTGYELTFDSFYLIPVFFAGISYGWGFSLQLAMYAVAFNLVQGFWHGHHFSQPSFFYFNVFNKLLSYSGYVALVELLRNAFLMQIRMSETDALTGLLNRGAFDKVFAAELQRMRRSGNSLGILLIDCDNFKDINDQLGRPVGDLALKKVAEVLRMHLRQVDCIARFGGDEFVVLLPDSKQESATQVAHKLNSALLVSMEREQWPITFSIGVHLAHGDDVNPTDAFLAKADIAMYAARKEGTNRILAI